MEDRIALDGVTFDDVLLIPRWSEVTPDLVDVSTRITASIELQIPLLSAPMDTVTESGLAIALAQEGGIGVIHKNMSVEAQAREVAKVKRSENGVVADPVVLSPDDSIARAVQLMSEQGVSGFPVTEGGQRRGKAVGILTRRDMKFLDKPDGRNVGQVMTKGKLVTAPANVSAAAAERLMLEHRVEKLLLVDAAGNLAGLITMRDLENVAVVAIDRLVRILDVHRQDEQSTGIVRE
jgi:IMP dehydrogenase